MKKTAKKLMPIPKGYVVLTRESTSVKSQWIEQENTRHALVDHVTVHEDGRLVFTFKNGTEVTELL